MLAVQIQKYVLKYEYVVQLKVLVRSKRVLYILYEEIKAYRPMAVKYVA
jgi:hypothetical protein